MLAQNTREGDVAPLTKELDGLAESAGMPDQAKKYI